MLQNLMIGFVLCHEDVTGKTILISFHFLLNYPSLKESKGDPQLKQRI